MSTKTKKAAKAKAAKLTPLDHGPRVQHQTGKLEVVEAADPDRPAHNVRRARRVYHYNTAWQRGALSNTERDAADRYLATCDIQDGARDGSHVGMSVRMPAWAKGHPHVAQLEAVAQLRQAHAAIGKDGAMLLLAYVKENLSAERIAQQRGIDPETQKPRETRDVTMGRIRGTLVRLAEHWGIA